jgi:50S ribosomal subunit-associated GTPase HflX
MEHIESVMPDALIYKVGNKRDLADEAAINRAIAEAAPQVITSAKTGENVIELFTEMAARLAGVDTE